MTYLILLLCILHFMYLFKCQNECSRTICNPRAGDLLIGREGFLQASSTCGLNGFDRYCIVTSTDNAGKSKCGTCYSKDPYQKFSSSLSHRIENVVSRLPQDPNRWWQSINGIHNVSIEISFETEFQFTFTHLRFKTYRPAAMYIERSKDYGRKWEKYAYFSENCGQDFPGIPERKRNNINEVLCTPEFSSIIPSEGGTVLFSADTSDWHSTEKFWNKKRNDITAITNLRVQFVRLHTFGDLKLDDNPNIRNKYYYAVSEWIIRGRCSCYGHASRCQPKEGQLQIKEMVFGVCECQHNTKGQHCEKCADFYNASPWQPADKNSTNECKKCDCNNHATSCHFNPVIYQQSGNMNGGVCDSCLHNTEGKNCERCKSGYFRNSAVPITSNDTCLQCQCHSQGSQYPQLCLQETETNKNFVAGSCICKENVEGYYCDRCKVNFWNLNGADDFGCTKCDCVTFGTIDNHGCDLLNGKCSCKINVIGNDCSICKIGYFNLSGSNPDGCSPCKCSIQGSFESEFCNKFSGQCFCKSGYSGRICNEIKSEWFVESSKYYLKYGVDTKIILPPVSKSGYYNFIITIDSIQMQISEAYVIILIISHESESSCQYYQDQMKLDKNNKYIIVPNKCLEKDLPISITIYTIGRSNNIGIPPAIVDIIVIPRMEQSNERTKSILADCLKYNFSSYPNHCNFLNIEISSKILSKRDPKKCNCNVTGSLDNLCNKMNGQCNCLPYVTGRQCNKCVPNFYGFNARGCKDCNCELSGSLNMQCSSDSGKCLCRENIEGQRCNKCKQGYWNFPLCEPCKCNQMSNICEQKTGKCTNCRGNSLGFNCEHCDNGYYGDTSRGIPCLKCHCLDIGINKNNSIRCSLILNTTNYVCHCKSGYSGRFCNHCDRNHFGNLLDKDGICKPCQCSKNINNMIPESCNSKTGECTKCMYNTAGFNCEKCASGYFGNGIGRTCKKCDCDLKGTNFKNDICNSETGKCHCLPNVMGQRCDQCIDGFFNISSKAGCLPCACDYPFGASNKFCNKLTGQCNCHSSRSGFKCNHCESGFWGNPQKILGCQACTCNFDGAFIKQCNRDDGLCICKSGITGRNCDKCKNGTDGQMPYCNSCGDCWLHWNNILKNIEKFHYTISTRYMSKAIPEYSRTIIIILDNMNQRLNFSNSVLKYFPNGFQLIITKMENKMFLLKNYLDQIYENEFNGSLYAIDETSNSIDIFETLVAKNKIKDIKGAYHEIYGSLTLNVNSVSESNNLLKRIHLLTKDLQNQIIDLDKIDTNTLNKIKIDIKGILLLIIENLKAFNRMTCTIQLNDDPLKCPQFCGVGCKPFMCFRNQSLNHHCITTRYPSFFNYYVWRIGMKKNLGSKLKKIANYIMNINARSIEDAYLKAQEEYKTSSWLIGVTNTTIILAYSQTIELLNKLNDFFNGTTNEAEFKLLVQNIGAFELFFNKEKIKNLENEIIRKKKKITSVERILKKSKDNNINCHLLKMNTDQAKTDSNILFNAITNINYIYNTSSNFKVTIGNLLVNFIEGIITVQTGLKKIIENQNKTESKHFNIIRLIKNIVMSESKIKESLNDFLSILLLLKNKTIQNFEVLNSIKRKFYVIENERNSINKDSKKSSPIVSDIYQHLKSIIDILNEKLSINRQKISNMRKYAISKESGLENLDMKIRSNLNQISKLRDGIYAKSEYHAKCLP